MRLAEIQVRQAPTLNPPREFHEMFRLDRTQEEKLKQQLREYDRLVFNRDTIDQESCTKSELLTIMLTTNKLVSFFNWFDKLIRGSTCPRKREENIERFLSTLRDYPETLNRTNLRAYYPNQVEKTQEPYPYHNVGKNVLGVATSIVDSGAFSQDEVVRVFSFLARLILNSDKHEQRRKNRATVLDLLDKKVQTVIKERCLREIEQVEQKELEMVGKGSEKMVETMGWENFLRYRLSSYKLKQQDIELCREHIDSRFALSITQHKDYPISEIDIEIAYENPESQFAKGLTQNPKFDKLHKEVA